MPPTTIATENVASLSAEDLSTGLPDDFDGVITEARFCATDYDGHIPEKALAVRLTFDADGFNEPIVDHWSAGKLEFFVPSLDGETPINVDQDDTDGYCALRVGRVKKISGSSNFGLFLASTRNSGFPREDESPDVRYLEGVKGHFNRLNQPKRPGIIIVKAEEGDEESRPKQYLAMTDYLGRVEASATPAPVGKKRSKSKTKRTKPTAAFDDAALAKVVLAAVQKASAKVGAEGNDQGLTKAVLAGLAMAAFNGKDKAAATKRVTEDDFLTSDDRGWVWDADEGVLFDGALYD